MQYIKLVSKIMLSALMLFAGTMHFVNSGFFTNIMPTYLPFHLGLVYLSGLFELALGVLLLVPKTSRMAAWGIIGLLIAVFPANIHLYQHQDLLPGTPLVHFLRLPLQGVFILWAYWHTKPEAKPTD